jgi:alpha-tubulin suppressor-like RCC1 family protein
VVPRSIGERLPGAVQSLALGAAHTCALLSGGGVVCWGSDEHGVLGRDTVREDIADPRALGPIDFGTSRSVVQITSGWHHVCVLFDDARARCWGRNDSGQLGNGHAGDYGDDTGETLNALPDLDLENIIHIAAGVSNTCAIVSGDRLAGTVHCWGTDRAGGIGDEAAGDFGDDESVAATRPLRTEQLATLVSSGDAVNCALFLDGSVRCWGNAAFGTLGSGEGSCNVGDERSCASAGDLAPVAALGEQFIHDLAMNQAHACALDNSGDLRCWGRNDQSRAGYPEARVGNLLHVTPGSIDFGPGVTITSFGLGMRHGCALDVLGDIRCWGEAGPQLGYAMPQNDGVAGVGGTLTPGEQYAGMQKAGIVQLGDTDGEAGNAPALRVYAGGGHSCAIMASGAVRCWGHNESGQLGYGPFAQKGNVGERFIPADDYARLGQHDVCLMGYEALACQPPR